MKVTADRAQLAHALAIVQRAISSRSTVPILFNVLITAEGRRLQLAATDLDTSIRSEIEAQIEIAGGTCVSASVLSDVVGSLTSTEVELKMAETRLGIRSGRSEYSILSFPPEEFPAIPMVPEEVSLSISQSALRDMVRQTIFAVAKEESNPILTGLLLEVREGRINLIATDTHRLAWKSAKIDGTTKQKRNMIIPSRPFNEVGRLLRDSDEPVRIYLAESQVAFSVDATTVVCRLIDGQFPSYEKVIPKEAERKITANASELTTALKRALIVARENAEKTVLRVDQETMVISAESAEIGQGREEVAVRLDGEPIEIAFNARYLVEALSVIQTEEAVLEFNGALNPGVIRALNSEDFLYVVMPMQV